MNQTIVLTAFPANRHIEVFRWFSIVTSLGAAKLHFSGCVVLKTKIIFIDSNRLRIYVRIAATYIIIDSAMTTCKITAGNGKTFEVPVRLGALLISQNVDLGEITHVLKHVCTQVNKFVHKVCFSHVPSPLNTFSGTQIVHTRSKPSETQTHSKIVFLKFSFKTATVCPATSDQRGTIVGQCRS